MDKLLPDVIYTTADLLDFHRSCVIRGLELMKRKNHDYSGEDDPFRNFRMFGGLGILVRAGDKLTRLQNLTEQGGEAKVLDETLEDTAIDLMNYAILWLAWQRDHKTLKEQPTTHTYWVGLHSYPYDTENIPITDYYMLDDDGIICGQGIHKDNLPANSVVLAEGLLDKQEAKRIQFSRGNP